MAQPKLPFRSLDSGEAGSLLRRASEDGPSAARDVSPRTYTEGVARFPPNSVGEVTMRALRVCAFLAIAVHICASPSPAQVQPSRTQDVARPAPSRSHGQTDVGASSSTAADSKGSYTQDPVTALLRMPLSFEENRGQAQAAFVFVAHGPSYALGVSPTGLSLTLGRTQTAKGDESSPYRQVASSERAEAARLELRFAGSSGGSLVTGLGLQPGRSNYFIGSDPSQWRRNVPHYSRVRIADVYPGVDVVLYGNQEQLEYDFAVAPKADPHSIQLRAESAQSVSIDHDGNAILHTAAGDVELKRPVAYQEIGGARHPVESAFQLTKNSTLRFAVGNYDRSRELIIDPVLAYSIGFGGTNGNQGLGLAVDASGNAYVAGNSCSSDFPAPAGNFPYVSATVAVPKCTEAFVTKLDATASTLIFSDFIGGTNGESTATHVAVDSSQNVYVAGATGAGNFPTVANIGKAAPTACALTKSGYNCPDGFIAKLSPDGSQILFSSLLGGSAASGAFQVKLNPVSGDLNILGVTNSSDFQPAPTTLETSFAGGSCSGGNACFNTFLLGLDPSTGKLRYGT